MTLTFETELASTVTVVVSMAAPAYAVRFFRRVHRHEPDGKRAGKIGGRRRRSALSAPLQFRRAAGVALAAQDRRKSIALDELEELLASLVAKRFTDQAAERMHVLAQRGVLDRKLNALAIHNARLSQEI